MDGQPYHLGPYFCENQHHALLHHALDLIGSYPRDVYADYGGKPTATQTGVALEFGVGDGNSLRCIASHLPVIGFDSFEGLPHDWRPGFDKGMFAADYDCLKATLPDNASLVRGLFEDTLPDYQWAGMRDIKLIHIDCDLYSSTKTVLENLPWRQILRPMGQDKAVIIFDEFYGYPGADLDEQAAWREFAEKSGIQWRVIGCGIQQWGIQLV